MKCIAVIGTLDTKGEEYEYLRQQIHAQGCSTYVIDCSVIGEPLFQADILNTQVAAAAGSSIEELKRTGRPDRSMEIMARGAAIFVERLYQEGKIQGAISMGGGQGTYLGMSAMAPLPIGFPKLMLSTLAFAVKELFADGRDTMVMDSIVDVAGLNRILRNGLEHAAAAICGQVNAEIAPMSDRRPVIAITMLGITTRCVNMVRERLIEAGYEVWVFHATGIGGKNMEELIRSGHIQGVLDLSITEVSQTIMGGTAATITTRLEAAGEMGLPQVVSLGGTDIVNFLGPETVPEKYRNSGRRFNKHNPTTTVMRVNEEDSAKIGRVIAEKLNRSKSGVRVIFPLRGVSEYDREGGLWFDADSDRVLFQSVRESLRKDIPVTELDYHINDRAFADVCVQMMLDAMKEKWNTAL